MLEARIKFRVIAATEEIIDFFDENGTLLPKYSWEATKEKIYKIIYESQ